jgi:hypothetical protein
MRLAANRFGVMDLLIVISLLMIVVGMFGPFVARSRAKAKASPVVTSAAPARPAR